MTIRFYHERGRNDLLNELFFQLAFRGSVRRENAFIYAQMEDWTQFCSCFAAACAEVSRDYRGVWLRQKYVFRVIDYDRLVRVWWNFDLNGVYYSAA